jgi:hypothetical protein
MMKSVTFSEVVRDGAPAMYSAAAVRRAVLFGVLLALGLAAITATFRLLDPGAPLGLIAGPVLVGGLLPVLASGCGRMEVHTRFNACHLVGTLDGTLDALGYAPARRLPGAVYYRPNRRARLPWNRHEVAVTVHDHALDIVGPCDTLRALQRRLAR